MYLHIARSGLTKPLRPRHEFYFTSVCVTSVQKLQNMTSAKHFSEFTQLFLVYICTCVIILKVTRFYLNLERKATLRLHRLCLSIHVFHADRYIAWYTKKRGLFHINKVNKSKYSHNWNIDGQLYRRGFASADWSRYIDEKSFFLKFLSTFNRYTSFPRVC